MKRKKKDFHSEFDSNPDHLPVRRGYLNLLADTAFERFGRIDVLVNSAYSSGSY